MAIARVLRLSYPTATGSVGGSAGFLAQRPLGAVAFNRLSSKKAVLITAIRAMIMLSISITGAIHLAERRLKCDCALLPSEMSANL